MAKTITIELDELETRGLRAFCYWLNELEANGTLEMYEYQLNLLDKLAEISGTPIPEHKV